MRNYIFILALSLSFPVCADTPQSRAEGVNSGTPTGVKPAINPAFNLKNYLPVVGAPVWYGERPGERVATDSMREESLKIAQEVKEPFEKLPERPPVTRFDDVVVAMRSAGLAVYVPGEEGAKEMYERFELAVQEIGSIDNIYDLTVPQLIRLNQDIMPVYRFLKAYQMAYDPAIAVVAPMSKSAIQIKSSCMDMGDPTPANGIGYKIQPIQNVVDPLLLPIYNAAINAPQVKGHYFYTSQNALWAVRSAMKLQDFDGDQSQAIDAVYPNGSAILKQYMKARADAIKNDPRGKRAQKELPEIKMDDPLWAMNKIAPGQYVHASSAKAQHATNIVFVNNTNKAMVFDTREFIGRPQTRVQRVSFLANLSKPDIPKMLQKAAHDVAMFMYKQGFLSAEGYLLAEGRNKDAWFIEINELISAAGPLGYLANSYTAITGDDVVSGQKVGEAERSLSWIAVVPIAKGIGFFRQSGKSWQYAENIAKGIQFGADQSITALNMVELQRIRDEQGYMNPTPEAKEINKLLSKQNWSEQDYIRFNQLAAIIESRATYK